MKRPRLVLRIYLIGLAQVAALAAALAIVRDLDRPERRRAPPDLKLAQYVVEDVIAGTGDPAVLQVRLQGLKEQVGLAVTLRDPQGKIIASTGAERPRPGPGHFEFDTALGHAGGTGVFPFESCDRENFDHLVTFNFLSQTWFAREVLRHWREVHRAGSQILNLGEIGQPRAIKDASRDGLSNARVILSWA